MWPSFRQGRREEQRLTASLSQHPASSSADAGKLTLMQGCISLGSRHSTQHAPASSKRPHAAHPTEHVSLYSLYNHHSHNSTAP
jgi:hypothetical protein